ncbi:MAG: prephenate dehydratase domain-containing protein [Myxococcota bacterium]
MEKLDHVRHKIDEIDSQIIDLLAERLTLVKEVGHIKQLVHKNLQDLQREHQQLDALTNQGVQKGLSHAMVHAIYKIIFEHSLAAQHTGVRCLVAYQGTTGAYSSIAAKRYFKDQAHLQLLGCETFLETLLSVQKNRADFAVVPVENSITGSIHEVLDLLPEMNLAVLGEIQQPISHCLLGIPGAKIDQIRRIYSHPQALMQCAGFIDSLGDNLAQRYTDTAMAAEKIKTDADPQQAAIASSEAANIFGLQILKSDIADQGNNQTRFVILGKK